MRVSEEAQARSHALQRQLEVRPPHPHPHPPPHPPPQPQLACAYAAEGSISGSVTGSVLSRAASPPFFLSAGLSESLLPDGAAEYGEYGASYGASYGAGNGAGVHGAGYGAGYGAASWSEQESSPPAGHILPLGTPRGTHGGEAAARMYRGYAPRS